MKRTRLPALLCAILMILSIASSAAAAPALPGRQTVQRVMSWNQYVLLKNKKTLQLYAWPNQMMRIADKKGMDVDDIQVDVKAAVKAKCNVDWILLSPLPHSFTIDSIGMNVAYENRTGKITVTGKKFKGTIKITQFGTDDFYSAVRKKNKLTFSFSLGGAALHYYTVDRYKLNEDGSYDYSTRKTVKEGAVKGSMKKATFSVKVAKGYRYEVSVGPALKNKNYLTGYNSAPSCSFQIDVTTLSGTQEINEFFVY